MGCGKTKNVNSIIKLCYYPVKNAYLIHYARTGAPAFGVFNFNSQMYNSKALRVEKIYPGCNFCWIDEEKIVFGGGVHQPSNEILEMYIVSILTMQARRLPDLLSSHADYCLIYTNSTLYAISGYNYRNMMTSAVEKCSLFSPWEHCKSIQIPRSFASAIGYLKTIYVLGGNTGYKSEAITELIETYNIEANSWSFLKLVLPLPLDKLGFTWVSESTVLFFGGEHKTGFSFYTFELDLSTMKYTEKDKLPVRKEGWLFLFEGKYYQNNVYAIENDFEQVVVRENNIWRVQKLKPDFIMNRK